MGGFAWVTLATNDSYSLGALVLAHSLRRVGTQHDLAVLITPGVTSSMREKLASVFTLVREVNVLDSKDEANLTVLQRPELGITFTKLHCWRLTQYEKCVFVDADALVVRNCDELFEREELSAAPDVGWPDCFNSGVFVFKPSQQTFTSITSFAASQGSFDGADQGLLNMYFSDWAHKDISKHLPFIYNMCSTATYSYAPAFKQYGENVRIVHFIGATKPWLQYFDTLTGIVQPPPGCNHLQPLLQIWWNIFCDNVHPQLTDVMAASNMSAIWHDSNPLIINSNTYNCARHLFNPDQDTYNETDSGTPDFSEFKDPWENYSVNTDPFINNIQQQTDDNKQYYSDVTHSHYTEPDQLISHNQCGAEPPPSREQSTSSSNEQDHSSLHSDQIFQASPQDNFSFENETHQDIVEHGHHYESHEVSKKQCSTDKTISDSDLLAENIEELSMIYDLLDSIRNELDSDNHTSHQNIHSPHHSDNINEPSTSTGSSSLHDHRQISCEIREHNSKQTDMHNNPNSSSHPASCTDPNNVETQNEMSASPCAENAHGGLAGALSRLTLGETRTDEQQLIEDHMRKQNWEQGHIDYMGRDSFDNIIKKMNQTLAAAPARQPSPAKETRQPKKSSLKSSEVEGAVEESESPLPGTLKSNEAKTTQKVVNEKKVKEKKSSK